METIALTRIANVLPYANELLAARVRIDDDLRRRRLPTMQEQGPDGYIPKRPLFECLHALTLRVGIRDLGYRAFRRWRVSCLDGDLLARVRSGRTLAERLTTFAHLARIEDTQFAISFRSEDGATRIVLSRGQPFFEGCQYGEWIQLAAVLGIVRDAVGAQAPLELTLQARYTPSPEACAEFRNAVTVIGAIHTSVVLSTRILNEPLADTTSSAGSSAASRTEQALSALNSERLAPRLKLVIRSYLADGYAPIGLAAELAQTSVRSLQRELAQSGVSYSDLVQQVRFEEATRMLAKDRTKVIDVALSLGYEDASHFSRAFKRICGVSPRRYRTESVAA